jgi:hypothetical protein
MSDFEPRTITRTAPGRFIPAGLLVGTVSAVLFGGTGIALGGPCTARIAGLERRINVIAPGPDSGPTAPQTVGAQLHHQPTPGAVEHAKHVANKDADAALENARKADAAGNAAACAKALNEARRLYGIER